MTLTEAREAINRIHDGDYNLTDDMREDLRRLHDSVDEQAGMAAYWERHDKALADLSSKFDDFRRTYVNNVLTGQAAIDAHEYDMRHDDLAPAPSAKELIDRMYTVENLTR